MLNRTVKSSGVWALQETVYVASAWVPIRVAPIVPRVARKAVNFMESPSLLPKRVTYSGIKQLLPYSMCVV
jgi:hypothetical protein